MHLWTSQTFTNSAIPLSTHWWWHSHRLMHPGLQTDSTHDPLSSLCGRFSHSPWLLGPPSPSSQSVMLFSIPSPPHQAARAEKAADVVAEKELQRWDVLKFCASQRLSSCLWLLRFWKKAMQRGKLYYTFLNQSILWLSLSLIRWSVERLSSCRGEWMLVLGVTHMHTLDMPLAPQSV